LHLQVADALRRRRPVEGQTDPAIAAVLVLNCAPCEYSGAELFQPLLVLPVVPVPAWPRMRQTLPLPSVEPFFVPDGESFVMSS
jgi:hypothetical protein